MNTAVPKAPKMLGRMSALHHCQAATVILSFLLTNCRNSSQKEASTQLCGRSNGLPLPVCGVRCAALCRGGLRSFQQRVHRRSPVCDRHGAVPFGGAGTGKESLTSSPLRRLVPVFRNAQLVCPALSAGIHVQVCPLRSKLGASETFTTSSPGPRGRSGMPESAGPRG